MEAIPLYILVLLLFVLFFMSAFFSGSETALMSVNRYQIAHLASCGNRSAKRVLKLLAHTDRLIGFILLGNNFTNIILTQLATYIGYRLYGSLGIAIATGALTLSIMLFAEVTPKVLASHYATKISLKVSLLFLPMIVLAYPFIELSNWISKSLLRLFGVHLHKRDAINPLSRAELYTLLSNPKQNMPQEYQGMLLGILDLEKRTVEDIMILRQDIYGIDLNDSIGSITQQLASAIYTRMPVYEGDINHPIGIIHLRDLLALKLNDDLSLEKIKSLAREPFYIAEKTPLQSALFSFKLHKRRTALIVDEYGDVQGLIALEDLLEEIVGDFTSDAASYDQEIQVHNNIATVNGSCHVRDLNRKMKWRLNESGPKTINGLILEHLETIPAVGTGFLINDHPFEIIRTNKHSIHTVKIHPSLKKDTTPTQEEY